MSGIYSLENFRETYAQSPQNISAVTKATHHISITYNQELGKFEVASHYNLQLIV
jgi:hypothetical protein